MLWLIDSKNSDKSFYITSCNIHKNNGEYEVWVGKPDGKTQLIRSSDNEESIREVKEAIDFAIEHKESALRI